MNYLTQFALTSDEIGNKFPKVQADSARLSVILTTVFGLLAATALLVLVIAGIRYISSTGDSNAMARIRNTIIYAAVGFMVSLSATAIVAFVLNRV